MRLILVFAVLVLAACERAAPTADPVPTPTPVNVADLLERSGDAMGELETFHFRLEHNRGGGTPLAETLIVTEAEGDVVSPDRISVDFTGTLGSFAVRSSLVTIGEDSYMTNPLNGAWEEVPAEVSPLAFFDPRSGIGAMMAQMRNPSLASQSESAFRVDGDLRVGALEPILGTAAAGDAVQLKLTIGADTLFLERAVIEGRVTASEADGVVRTIILSGFNEPVSIEPPR